MTTPVLLLPPQGGSSLDLSPSDSCGSGGTYMWDEEGLEPLGGAAVTTASNSNTTHHIGSFDSDLNSIVRPDGVFVCVCVCLFVCARAHVRVNEPESDGG